MNPEINQMPPRQEEKQEEKKNGNTVLLTVIGVATLLVALVGATFAYFSATANNSNNQSVVIATGKPTALEYKTTDQISLQNAQPGATDTGKFTVKNNDAQYTFTYDLDLVIVSNSFNNLDGNNQLMLKFTASASTGATAPTLANFRNPTDITQSAYKTAGAKINLVQDASIAKGVTHTYDSTLTFVNFPESKQNSNQQKTFAAHVDISDVRTVNNP